MSHFSNFELSKQYCHAFINVFKSGYKRHKIDMSISKYQEIHIVSNNGTNSLF